VAQNVIATKVPLSGLLVKSQDGKQGHLSMRISPILASLLLLSTGCHRSVSAHSRSVQSRMEHSYAGAQIADAAQHALDPSDLVALHQEKGVGLGLQITERQFRAGQNIPLLLIYEDVAASGPVSSTGCSGFSILIENVDDGTELPGKVNPCEPASELAQNNVPLVIGNRRFLHTSLFGVRQELTQPGRYLIRANWQSYRPRAGAFQQQDGYVTVQSNSIPIVVTP
jgi:hypothetical protein